jgi:hypothetical protein
MHYICRLLAISACSVLLLACGRFPSEEVVKADFLKQHPTWNVLSIHVGEGDAAAAYYHIRYRRPDGAQLFEEVWLYLHEGEEGWKLRHQEAARAESERYALAR